MIGMYGAIMGMSGLRAYAFDGYWANERAKSAAGAGAQLQTGAGPFEVGTDRWQAMASSFNLIDRLTPYLFQQQASAEDLGALLVTGARTGPRGNLFMALNGSEEPATVTVDLRPYRLPSASLVRYRISGATVSTARLPPADDDTVTFAPGETVAWLFAVPKTAEGEGPSVRFAEPVPDVTVSGRIAVTIDAAGPTAASSVELYADGRLVAVAAKPPFTFDWDTTGVRAGVWHGLRAVARAAGGGAAEARSMVKVLSPPSLAAPAKSAPSP